MNGRRNERQTSAPASSKPFPSSGYHVPTSFSNRPSVAGRRNKTLSDSSQQLDSPLSIRARNAQGPPSAFGHTSFARPSPAGRRTRKTSGNSLGMSDHEARSPSFESPPFQRSMSSSAVAQVAYDAADAAERSFSPSSPTDGVDSTSFHARAKSPEEMDEIDHHIEGTSGSEIGSEDGAGEEVDYVESNIGNDSLNPRLSRISVSLISLQRQNHLLTIAQTESAASLRTSHDKLRALQKQNAELARKLKESERQLAISG